MDKTILILLIACICCICISISIGGGIALSIPTKKAEPEPEEETIVSTRKAIPVQQSGTPVPTTTTKALTTTTKAPTTTPMKRTYSMYKNTDYKNQGDISDKYNTNPEECKIVCDNIQNCSGFVTNGGACFFKSKDVNNPSSLQGYDYYYTGFTPKPLVTCTSDGTWSALTVNVGEVITRGTETARCKADGSWDMSSIPARTYSIIKNTDYKNQGDISEKYNTNPEECKTACNNMENCGGFVTNGNACFFKTKNVTNPSFLQGFDYYKVV